MFASVELLTSVEIAHLVCIYITYYPVTQGTNLLSNVSYYHS